MYIFLLMMATSVQLERLKKKNPYLKMCREQPYFLQLCSFSWQLIPVQNSPLSLEVVLAEELILPEYLVWEAAAQMWKRLK